MKTIYLSDRYSRSAGSSVGSAPGASSIFSGSSVFSPVHQHLSHE